MNDEKKLKRITLHRATDRRVYNGAPCSDMQREWNSRQEAKDYLKSLGVHVTYFPAGEFYVGFDERSNILTEDCKSFEVCANKVLEYLEQN